MVSGEYTRLRLRIYFLLPAVPYSFSSQRKIVRNFTNTDVHFYTSYTCTQTTYTFTDANSLLVYSDNFEKRLSEKEIRKKIIKYKGIRIAYLYISPGLPSSFITTTETDRGRKLNAIFSRTYQEYVTKCNV